VRLFVTGQDVRRVGWPDDELRIVSGPWHVSDKRDYRYQVEIATGPYRGFYAFIHSDELEAA
jgi:hypothetical protein